MKFVIAGCWLLLVARIPAEEPHDLDLGAVLLRVDAVNERSLIARSHEKRSVARVREARSALKPQLNLDASIANSSYNDDHFAVEAIHQSYYSIIDWC